jgi:hypothetical protein
MGVTLRYLQRMNPAVSYDPAKGTSKAALLAAIARAGPTYLKVCLSQRRAAVDDDVVRAVAEHCLGLMKLDVGGCTANTDVGLRAVAEHCPGLTELSVGARCPRLHRLHGRCPPRHPAALPGAAREAVAGGREVCSAG